MSEQVEKSETKEGKTASGKKRHVKQVLFGFILAALFLGAWMWYKSKVEVTTDNAFVQNHIHSVSPRVSGHVLKVWVEDNQRVEQGQLLVELDPVDYQVQVNTAVARLDMARNETSGEYARVAEAQAGVRRAEANLAQARLDLERGQALFAREVIPSEQLDRLKTAAKVAEAQRQQALETLRQARAVIGASQDGGVEARVAQRAAELEAARLKLAYTRITAPAAGYITRKSVEEGNNVQAGQPLLAVVQMAQPWVVANLKEGQLTHVEPGQKVDFVVDAYPGREFSGHVDSIMAGSLLPPENATGNYVKVVQRVPVKILIDPASDPDHLLRVGMSVVPVIHTGKGLGDVLAHLNPFH